MEGGGVGIGVGGSPTTGPGWLSTSPSRRISSSNALRCLRLLKVFSERVKLLFLTSVGRLSIAELAQCRLRASRPGSHLSFILGRLLGVSVPWVSLIFLCHKLTFPPRQDFSSRRTFTDLGAKIQTGTRTSAGLEPSKLLG